MGQPIPILITGMQMRNGKSGPLTILPRAFHFNAGLGMSALPGSDQDPVPEYFVQESRLHPIV